MNHTVIYIEMHILCILLLGILFFLNLKHWRPRYLNSMSAIYLITMLSSLLDIAWILLDGLNRHVWLYHIVNIVYLSSFEFIGFCWLDHCALSFPFRLWKNNRRRFGYLLPAIAISLLIVLSAFTGWIYVIDAAGVYYRGPWFFIQPMGYIYMFVASGLSLRARGLVKHSAEKKKFEAMALIPLPSLLLGVLQLMAPPGNLPTMQFSITIALLIEFTVFLGGNVTQDSLTGLSNRYALDRALNAKMSSVKRNRVDELYVLVGDLDRFKSINDTYGHMEGDRALKIAADTLKRIFHDTPAILSRMGGDEFAIILEADSPETVRRVMDEITRELEIASRNEPFELEISLGMARYNGQDTAIDFMKEADHALYRAKKKTRR